MTKEEMAAQISRRRIFGIISHPDAGKTTLTEKLLLHGGAIREAGTVKARKNAKFATSDWMEIEKQRGISVTSSVMQFEYEGKVISIMDTPGHNDFGEDTYRILTSVDSAVMVIDAAKGIEAQTKKLFAVCKMRGIPIFTFMNKLDREAKDPLELLSELEEVLGMPAAANRLRPQLPGRIQHTQERSLPLQRKENAQARRKRRIRTRTGRYTHHKQP